MVLRGNEESPPVGIGGLSTIDGKGALDDAITAGLRLT
jgi:hypothetical protein